MEWDAPDRSSGPAIIRSVTTVSNYLPTMLSQRGVEPFAHGRELMSNRLNLASKNGAHLHLQCTPCKFRCCYLKYLKPEVAGRNILSKRRF